MSVNIYALYDTAWAPYSINDVKHPTVKGTRRHSGQPHHVHADDPTARDVTCTPRVAAGHLMIKLYKKYEENERGDGGGGGEGVKNLLRNSQQ